MRSVCSGNPSRKRGASVVPVIPRSRVGFPVERRPILHRTRNLVHYGKRLGVGSAVPFKLGIINSEFDFDATVPMVSANRGA